MARARKVWIVMLHILRREGAAPQVSGFFFKAVVQAVLIFRAENWVVTPRMGKDMGGFHTQVARRLTGGLPRKTLERRWRYTSEATAREETWFHTMEEYIRYRQNMFAQ